MGASSASIESDRSEIGAGVGTQRRDIRTAIKNATDPAIEIGSAVPADSSKLNRLAIRFIAKLILLLAPRSSLILLFEKLERQPNSRA